MFNRKIVYEQQYIQGLDMRLHLCNYIQHNVARFYYPSITKNLKTSDQI